MHDQQGELVVVGAGVLGRLAPATAGQTTTSPSSSGWSWDRGADGRDRCGPMWATTSRPRRRVDREGEDIGRAVDGRGTARSARRCRRRSTNRRLTARRAPHALGGEHALAERVPAGDVDGRAALLVGDEDLWIAVPSDLLPSAESRAKGSPTLGSASPARS